MGLSSKNPFEILGITTEMASRLNERDLFSIIKSMYRSLQKVYHPDRSSRKSKKAAANADRAVELNLAFEQLNMDKSADSFRRFHRTYAGRKNKGFRKKIDILENYLQQNNERQAALADGFMAYLLKGLPWAEDADEDQYRTPHPANIKLGLNDVAINQNIRASSWSLGSNYKEITFDALGSMLYRPVGRSKPFPVNFIHIIGIIETSKIELAPLMNKVTPKEGFFKSPALDARYDIDGAPLQVLNTMSMEKFKQHCLPLLQPGLLERAYLFSIQRPVFEQENAVSVEGVIVKISKL